MSLIVRRPDTSTGGASPHAGAVGPDARQIYKQLVEVLSRIREERHQVARHKLIEVFRDGRESGWDGQDARPVSVAAYVHARDFLEILPSAFPTPDVSADPDGEIAFDWIVNRLRMFAISFGADAQLAYSGLLDGSSFFGTEPISERFPAAIGDFLRRLYEEA